MAFEPSNLGERQARDNHRRIALSRAADMEAYDRLPLSVRQAMDAMTIGWNAISVEGLLNKHGERVTLAVLAKTERDLQAEHWEMINNAIA